MSQDDQVLSVRLRRKNTGTPWGFRMHGGAEYAQPMFIQHVNPKSLAFRQGLRINDRLLAVGNAPTHNLTHEQVKMEIIRAGNELDFVVQRNMAADGQDQQDSRPARPVKQQPQYDQPDEEPSEYRGYTNPKVQSRSFKMLQESLNYTEAGEEGISIPSGQTPGEGVVLRAYSEGKRRMEELAQINPRNFITESPIYERGQNLLKCSEEDEEIIAKLKCSWKSKEPEVAKAKSYTPGSGSGSTQNTQQSQSVDLSGSSVLAPAASQQIYLQQAHAHYGDQNAPVIQTAVVQQPVKSTIQHTVQSTVQQPVHAQGQKAPRRRERKRQPKEQQAVSSLTIQSPVSPAPSSGFIPTTDTVSSVAEELNLKHESTVKRSDVQQRASQPQVEQKATPQQIKVATVVQQPVESKPSPKQEVVQPDQPKQIPVDSKPKQTEIVQAASVIAKAPETKVEEAKTTVETRLSEPNVKEVNTEVVIKPSRPAVEVQTAAVSKPPEPAVEVQTAAVSKPPEPAVEVQTAAVSKPAEPAVEVQTAAVSKPPEPAVEEVNTIVVEKTDVQEVKTAVDTVDATVEPSGDVIREYGERMAETVISESIQDASQGIKDSTDGTSLAKQEQIEKVASEEGKSETVVEVNEKTSEEKVEKSEPEVVTKEQEQVDSGN